MILLRPTPPDNLYIASGSTGQRPSRSDRRTRVETNKVLALCPLPSTSYYIVCRCIGVSVQVHTNPDTYSTYACILQIHRQRRFSRDGIQPMDYRHADTDRKKANGAHIKKKSRRADSKRHGGTSRASLTVGQAYLSSSPSYWKIFWFFFFNFRLAMCMIRYHRDSVLRGSSGTSRLRDYNR